MVVCGWLVVVRARLSYFAFDCCSFVFVCVVCVFACFVYDVCLRCVFRLLLFGVVCIC